MPVNDHIPTILGNVSMKTESLVMPLELLQPFLGMIWVYDFWLFYWHTTEPDFLSWSCETASLTQSSITGLSSLLFWNIVIFTQGKKKAH